jgi:hypothetical protein
MTAMKGSRTPVEAGSFAQQIGLTWSPPKLDHAAVLRQWDACRQSEWQTE